MSRFVLTAQLQLQAPNNVAQVVRQIQSQLNNVSVNVQVQGAAQAQRQLQQVTAQTQAATTAADRMGRAFALSIRRFAAFSIATRAVSLFTSTLSSAIQTAIDFEREMVRVSQVTGESIGKLRFLTKAITDLSTGLGVSSKDLLTTGQLLLQAGVNAKDTEIALKTLAKAALAPNFDSLSETTEGAIAILAQFQEGVGALERQLGAINAVAGAFAVEAGDLIDVIRRAGGVFKASGGDLNELIALFTSVRATTRESAESIGTGLRTIFTRIQRPKTIEFLKQFGVELVDMEGKFVGPYEAVKRLSGALAGLGEGDITFIRIAEELGGFRQIGKVLPLLQQFSTAQAALNVAQKAGNSLTADAATAQQALAIRILKVKEEFLALIRGMTETTTFQVMANTALSLASALIKIGEAIKPLLPLLAAVAAVKFARGISGFAASFAGGMKSGRTYNTGGKVHHFARGGLVPGTGNRDTVPAMLQPGEFVIRKSSVKKMGVGGLAAMNENRYAAGGLVSQNSAGMAIADTFEPNSRKDSAVTLTPKDIAIATPQYGSLKSGSIASRFSDMNKATISTVVGQSLSRLGFGKSSKQYKTVTAGISQDQQNNFGTIVNTQMRAAIKSGASRWSQSMGVRLKKEDVKFADDFVLPPGMVGSFFELAVDAFQGRPLTTKTSEDKRPFDFTQGLSGGANAKLFNNLAGINYVDAKKSLKSGVSSSDYQRKIAGQIAIENYQNIIAELTNARERGFTVEDEPKKKNLLSKSAIQKARRAVATPRKKESQQETFATGGSVGNRQLFQLKNLGGIIQKFATGGMASSSQAILSKFNKQQLAGKRLLNGVEMTRAANKAGYIIEEKNNGLIALSRNGKKMHDDLSRSQASELLLSQTQGHFALGGLIQKFANGGRAKGMQSGKRGFFFDVDDTLLESKALVREGEPDPYADFRGPKGRAFLESAVATKYAAMARARAMRGDDVWALTARPGDKDTVAGIRSFASKNGINMKGVIGVAGIAQKRGINTAAAKAMILQRFARNYPGGMVLVDDLVENLISAQQSMAGSGVPFKGLQAKRFATGGGVGTDTVPALLTPGEFVVNKKSAQAIGYGSLNRMNKVGKYAKGGVVQRFAAGGAVGDSAAAAARTTDSVMASMTKKDVALVKMAMKNNSEVFDKVTKELQDMLYMEKEVTAAYKALARSLRAGETAEKGYQQALEAAEASLTSSSKSGKTVRESPQQQPSASERFKAASSPLEKQQIFLEEKAKTGTLTNKEIGKGVVAGMSTAQTKAIMATNNQAKASMEAAKADQIETNASSKAAQADQIEAQNSHKAASMDFGSMAMGLSMVSGTIQAMLPPLDENSSLLLTMSHGLLGIITTVTGLAFALSAFGVTLSASTIASAAAATASFFMGTAGTGAATSVAALGVAAANAAISVGASGFGTMLLDGAKMIAPYAKSIVNVAGPLIAVAGGAYLAAQAFRYIYDSIYDFDNRLKQSIEKGDVQGAKQIAADKGAANSLVSVKSAGTIASATAVGAAIGTAVLPAFGTVIGAVIGFGVGLISIAAGMTDSTKRLVALAAAQAGAVKVTKILEKTQKDSAAAMERFNKGLISSGELLDTFQPAFAETAAQSARVSESVQANSDARSKVFNGAILRNIGAYLGGGLFGMETVGTRNARLESESVGLIQGQTKAVSETFSQSREARNAAMRSAIYRGADPEEQLKARGMDVGSMQEQRRKLLIQASEADTAGRSKEAAELRAQAEVYQEEIITTKTALENLKKEVEMAKAKFAALNLGFRSVTASADAAAVRMTNAMNSFDLAAIPGVNALNTLEASLTAAGQNISKAEFDSSLAEVSGILQKFGADAKQISAFEDLTKGVATVQREFPSIFETLKSRLDSGELKKMSADDIGKEFKNIVGQSLDNAGIGDAAKKRIMDAMGDVQISPEDMAKIDQGDYSVLEKYLGDAAEEVGKHIKEFGQKWITANQELIKATQERIEAERNLVAAQREAVDLYMEGRDVQAKYGGRAVSMEERQAAIVAKANAGAAGAGIGTMRTGSVAELRQRQMQIVAGFGRIESMRGRDGSAKGAEGAELQATQQNLQEAQKQEIEMIRSSIKLKEEELKIIQEKNKLEKDSLESLISGDIDKFFEQQAAIGAQAAIATGDMDAANMFGGQAVGDAFRDMQRQSEAGVQTMFGQRLSGAGGLLEQGAGAALASRGIMDPRMAQRLAGTTAEEEGIKSTLQELGGLLGEAGSAGAAMAEMQVQTAQMKVEYAQLNIDNLDNGGVGMYRGGVVYANRGMFVPRGTDTVPAMLTPGEFVVRREAVNRGNNLQLLQAINSGNNAGGMARGGKVGYYNNGGKVQYKADGGILGNIAGAFGIDPQLITNLGNIFNTFVSGFNKSIENLKNTKVQISMDSVNVNVNLTGAGMLNQINDQAKQKIKDEIISAIKNQFSVGSNGRLVENNSANLAKPGQGQ